MFDRVLNNTLSKSPGEMASGFPGRQFCWNYLNGQYMKKSSTGHIETLFPVNFGKFLLLTELEYFP